MRRSCFHLAWVIGLVLGCGPSVQAVVLYSNSTNNTSAPTDALANSGWQFEGKIGGFIATPIAPNYILTARHLTDDGWFSVGATYSLNGTDYTTDSLARSPNSDLVILHVSGTGFTSWAPIYTNSVADSELNKPIVVYGDGTTRGAEVRVNGVLKGWQWGSLDFTKSWGQNTISDVVHNVSGLGNFLAYSFDADGGPNEGSLSGGDSGGGVFINDNGIWKLAGINYGVDSPWGFSSDSSQSFNADIFDGSGLYTNLSDENGIVSWQQLTDAVAGSSYSTQLSSSANLAWIKSVIGEPTIIPVPEPAGFVLAASALGLMLRRRRAN